MKRFFTLLLVAGIIGGCTSGGVRAKGGRSSHVTPQSKVQLVQPENPKDSAIQNFALADTVEIPLPAGTPVSMTIGTNQTTFVVASNTVIRQSHAEKSDSKLGAAQPDIVGETIAKLKSVRWLVGVGICVFLGGLACAFIPYLEAFLGGITPGLAIAGGGLALAILPYIVIGNEKLLIVLSGAAAVGVLGAIWIHKHGGMTAELAQMKGLFGQLRIVAPTQKPNPGPTNTPGAPL